MIGTDLKITKTSEEDKRIEELDKNGKESREIENKTTQQKVEYTQKEVGGEEISKLKPS